MWNKQNYKFILNLTKFGSVRLNNDMYEQVIDAKKYRFEEKIKIARNISHTVKP